jgi:glucokinase
VSLTLLAGDIGGTKTLLSLYRREGEGLQLLASERFPSADWSDLAAMVTHFLGRGEAALQPRPAAACFAVAGPVQGGRARLTNLPWQLSELELSRACAIPQVELVNDFAVLIHGLPHLRDAQLATVRAGTAQAEEPRLILGAGTGLGVALGIPTPAGLKAVASEAAHGEFAPRSEGEWQLKQWLAQELGLERVSIERVVSGTGLGHVARWLLSRRDPRGEHPLSGVARRWWEGAAGGEAADLPAAVAAAAAQADPLATEALNLWLAAYGSVVGDLALACLSRGGIWLAGGTAATLLEGLRGTAFQQAFLAKGRLRPALEAMPIQAVIDPEVGPFSAAWRAVALLG